MGGFAVNSGEGMRRGTRRFRARVAAGADEDQLEEPARVLIQDADYFSVDPRALGNNTNVIISLTPANIGNTVTDRIVHILSNLPSDNYLSGLNASLWK